VIACATINGAFKRCLPTRDMQGYWFINTGYGAGNPARSVG
jgi:hypothetical protein